MASLHSERTSKSPFLQNDRVHYNGEQSEDDQHFSGDGFTKSDSVVGELEDTPPPYEQELAKTRDVKHLRVQHSVRENVQNAIPGRDPVTQTRQ